MTVIGIVNYNKITVQKYPQKLCSECTEQDYITSKISCVGDRILIIWVFICLKKTIGTCLLKLVWMFQPGYRAIISKDHRIFYCFYGKHNLLTTMCCKLLKFNVNIHLFIVKKNYSESTFSKISHNVLGDINALNHLSN